MYLYLTLLSSVIMIFSLIKLSRANKKKAPFQKGYFLVFVICFTIMIFSLIGLWFEDIFEGLTFAD